MKVTVIPIKIYALGIIPKGTGRPGKKRTSGDHPDHSNIKIDQNSEKSPEDFRRLAFTQTPGKINQLTLV